mgnify:CR=1 FL=1|tara:strand:+ start:2236 stop:3141 length:906 start_codon:yes stop_codon:yes gene_type:complete
MNKQIFWIASYPKSGNTLLRSILISLFFTKDGNFLLEESNKIGQFDTTNHVLRNRNVFGDDYYRLKDISVFYKYMDVLQSKEALSFKQDFIFLKTHSGLFEVGGNPFTKARNTRGIIYIIRDPRDICISYSKHSGVSIDETIEFMTNDIANGFWMEPKKIDKIFSDSQRPLSFMSSWDKHVLSWISINWNVPKLILKYEDLVYEKKENLNNIIKFYEDNYNFSFQNKKEKINNIMKSTAFDKLKKEEEEKGFSEATKNSRFFSKGEKEQWLNKLSNKQISKIEKKFSFVMKKFNYKLSSEY